MRLVQLTLSSLTFVTTLLLTACQAWASYCSPYDFAEVADVQQSPEMELAFVLTATQEQFDRTKERIKSAGAYDLFAVNYKEAQERAREIAQATKFDYRSSYAASYFAQHITSKAYSACLENDRETPGLRIWLRSRQGDYLSLAAAWVGSDSTAVSAKYDSDPTVDGGQIISQPSAWQKGRPEEIVIKKSARNSDVFLGLRVGGQSSSFVVVREPPNVVWRTARVTSPTLLRTSSHGPNPGCSAGQARDCIQPSHLGGSFVAGTAAMIDSNSSDPSRYGQNFTSTPAQVCVVMTQSTGACEVSQTATGRLMALERYPEVQE